jgi:hypothetical protein
MLAIDRVDDRISAIPGCAAWGALVSTMDSFITVGSQFLIT